MKRTLDLDNLVSPDATASAIANQYQTWNQYRKTWLDDVKELRNYVYATDTSTTENKRLPWSNSTTTRVYTSPTARTLILQGLRRPVTHHYSFFAPIYPAYILF